MTFKRFVCILLLVTLTAVLVRPARAEAMDPQLILILVGVGVAVIGVIAILIIANASEGRRRTSAELTTEALEELERRAKTMLAGPALIIVQTPAVDSP